MKGGGEGTYINLSFLGIFPTVFFSLQFHHLDFEGEILVLNLGRQTCLSRLYVEGASDSQAWPLDKAGGAFAQGAKLSGVVADGCPGTAEQRVSHHSACQTPSEPMVVLAVPEGEGN